MKRPPGVPENAHMLALPVKGKSQPRIATVWFWQENPDDPRTVKFSDLPDDMKEDYEIRVLPVPFLVRKDLPE